MSNNANGEHVTTRRHEILDAARKVFDACGYEATTIDAVAVEAKMSKGSIYNYFDSKQELFKQVFLEDQTIRDYQAAMLAAGTTVMQKLDRMLDMWFRQLAEQQRTCRLVLEYWATAAREGREGEMSATFQRMYRQWRELLTDLIARGVASGEFSSELNPSMAGALIMALVDGVGMEAMLNIGLVVDEELLSALKRAIFAALLAPERKPK
jgi:AcrR family transcriptional regulator